MHFVLKLISDSVKPCVQFWGIFYQLQVHVSQMLLEECNGFPIHVLCSSGKKISKCQKTVEFSKIEMATPSFRIFQCVVFILSWTLKVAMVFICSYMLYADFVSHCILLYSLSLWCRNNIIPSPSTKRLRRTFPHNNQKTIIWKRIFVCPFHHTELSKRRVGVHYLHPIPF